MKPSRGFILVIVVALLGVLAFLAVDFASKSRQSRLLSQSYLGLTKATLSARSGLEKGVEGSLAYGRQLESGRAFQTLLSSAGEDRNRNEVLDAGEDLDGDGRLSILPLDEEKAPSLALPDASGLQSQLVSHKGLVRGVTWVNMASDPDQFCTLRIRVPSLDLNAGVTAGEGPEGVRYQANHGVNYSVSSTTHPFNIPLRRLLNSWGNYHKYLAMVRPNKTYNYKRDVLPADKQGLIDSTDNLMSNLAAAKFPSAKFDDFNPSGNHALDAANAPIISEMPLGDLLLSVRPAGGYRSVESALSLVEDYVHSWTDKAGRKADGSGSSWLYADGTPIPVMTPARIKAIVEEFRDLAVTQIQREPGWVFRLGTPSPAPANEPAAGGFFENHDNRHYLFTEFYAVPALKVDINRAPLSVLAALVQAPGQIKLRSYRPYASSMGTLENPVPFQDENNYPCYWSYSSTLADKDLISGKPLFSMTESLRLGQDIMAGRRTSFFQNSTADLRNFLRSWRKGYDAKHHSVYSPTHHFNTILWGVPPSYFDNVSNYFDYYHGHRRVQILAELLNPHPNDARVVWDEALPLAVENRRTRMNPADVHPLRGRHYVLDEADGSTSEKGPEACFQSPSIKMASLGWYGPTGQSRLLVAVVRLYEGLSLGTQSDFELAGQDPVTHSPTLGSWITYPELPSIPPCPWTGQLALKPSTRECPWGDTLQMRILLNGYELKPTGPVDSSGAMLPAWPAGPRDLRGPATLPARGTFRNSLQPPPGEALTSLYPQQATDIDSATDLMPGGGIRMSPWNNSIVQGPFTSGNWPNHKEATLVLRNSLVTQNDDDQVPDETEIHQPVSTSFILPSFREGVVSFYVKPKVHPDRVVVGGNSNMTTSTLFYMPFNVFDKETESRCLSMGMSAQESEIRSQFVGSLRLTWTCMMLTGSIRQYGGVPNPWPAASGYAGYPAFPGQVNASPFYFGGMEGWTNPTTSAMGYVLSWTGNFPGTTPMFASSPVHGGDGIEGHWSTPNQYRDEMIVLEWDIHKFAYSDDITKLYPSTLSVTPTWGTWDATDAFPAMTKVTAYTNDITTPLHLFDTSDPLHADYHSVRKSFYIQGPLKVQLGAGNGTTVRDRRGDMQALIETGRWNHILIAWKDLWSVLGNSPPTKGGCLSTYVNGHFKKVSPQGYKTAAIFFNSDSSAAYRGASAASPGVNYSSWDPEIHAIYQTTVPPNVYFGPVGVLGAIYPSYPKTFYVPMDSVPNNTCPLSPPRHSQGIGLLPHTSSFFNADRPAINSPRKILLFRRFPPRFYFGFEPHCFYSETATTFDVHSYFASNFTWGSFMDVQIFDRATPSGPDSPLASDGGFLPALPGFYSGAASFSPYPNLSTAAPAVLRPLQIAGAQGFVDQGVMLVNMSWSAHLPEYHQFWDDQGPTPGPDSQDVQELEGSLMFNGMPMASLSLSQDPASSPVYHWEPTVPLEITQGDDLSLSLKFTGPEVVMSTPIVENIELTFQRLEPRYESFQME
ncbi:MAG: hypothetical protein AB7F75_01800 [Planctomycetota bacterium]